MRIRSFLLKGILLAGLASPAVASDGSVVVGGRVLETSGKALAGATVELFAEPRPTPRSPAAECAAAPPVSQVSTGSDGAFRLLAPEPGLWRVRVTAAGSPVLEHPLHPLFTEAQLAPLTVGGTVQEGGAARTGGWRPLPPKSSDDGAMPEARGEKAPASLPGRVVDALTGEPVQGALVWPAAEPGAWVRAAADGRFLAEMPAGVQPLLRVAARGYLMTALEVPLGARDAGLVRLQPAATLAGRVLDRTGRPVADAAVRVAFGPQVAQGIETFSRPDGRFLLSSVPSGRSGELRAVLDTAGRRLAARRLLPALRPRESRSGLRLVLSLSPKVLGRVLAPDGRGVAGALLRLLREPPRSEPRRAVFDPRPAAETQSRGDGRFNLLDAGSGRFRLELESEGFVPVTLPAIELSETGGDVDLGDLVLRASGTLNGTVLQEEGTPVAAAAIEARSAGGGGPWRTESRDDGTFALQALPPGARLEISVRHRGFAPVVLPDVEVSPEPLEIVLHPRAALSGRVVDAAGRGVGEAVVVVTATLNPRTAATAREVAEKVAVDDDGRFTLPRLASGTISLEASAPGYHKAYLAGIEVTPGESRDDLELVLEEAAVLVGSVRAPDGAPLAGARVSVRGQDAEGGVLGASMAGADGTFRIDGLEAGPVEARAEHPRFRRAARTLGLSLGENRVDLVLGRGLPIAGKVVDGDGEPLAEVELGVEEIPGAPRSRSTVSLADGSFLLTGLEPGRLVVTGRRAGFVPARLELELGEEPIENLVVRLERGGAIAGRLLGLSPSELGWVEVEAFAPDRGSSAGQVWPDGRYRIEGLSPGEWTVVAFVGARQARAILHLGGGEEELDLQFDPAEEGRSRTLRE